MIRSIAIAASFLAFSFGAATAEAPGDVSFRAAYELTASPDDTGEVINLNGIEVQEWSRDCAGGSFHQRTSMLATLENGERTKTDIEFSSWEAADASQFRFLLTIKENDVVAKTVDGIAERADDGTIGVTYRETDEGARKLPAKVVFPWQHLRRVYEQAAAGTSGISHSVLRGEDPETDPAYVRVQVLGEGLKSEDQAANIEDKSGLLNQTIWRLASAVFEDRQELVPTFEMSEVLTESGFTIAADYRFPYLTIHSKLRKIEKLPGPDCG